jgi:hypothetical protein
MADPLCSQCLATGLAVLPVRQTLLPKKFMVDRNVGDESKIQWDELPPILQMPPWADCKWQGENFGDNAQPGLRVMRGGYLYVHYPSARTTIYGVSGQWEVYTVNHSGTFSLSEPGLPKSPLSIEEEGKTPCSRCGGAPQTKLGYITIPKPDECTEAYLAFSEHPWSTATRRRIEGDPASRMKRINPQRIHAESGEGSAGAGWANASLFEIKKVLEYCPEVNYRILENVWAQIDLREEIVPQAKTTAAFHELTAHSRSGISTDPKLCGLHSRDVLRRWHSVFASVFRYTSAETDTRKYANNSLETPIDQGSDWSRSIVANYLQPMSQRSKTHPGILLALDDPLGVAYELNGCLNQLQSFRMQYETQRRAEIQAAYAIEELPATVAYKESNRQLTKKELDQRKLGPNAHVEPVDVPAVYGYEAKTGMQYVREEARTDYHVIQSPQDALEEARRGGLLGAKMYDAKKDGSYKNRVVQKSREPMTEAEYAQRKPYLAADATVEPVTIGGGDYTYDGISTSEPETRYVVKQSDASALQEASRPGPLMTKVLDDRIWSWSDFHDTADYFQEVDWVRYNAFKGNYQSFIDDQKSLVELRCKALAQWLQYDGLYPVLEDYDPDVGAECLSCAEALECLLEGIDASDDGMALYAQWAELKIQGSKNLLVRLLSCGLKQEEVHVTSVLKAAYEHRDTDFDDVAKVNPWTQHMKAPINLYKAQIGIHVSNTWSADDKGDQRITVPKTGTKVKPVQTKVNAQRFEAWETLGGGGRRGHSTKWWGRDYVLFKWIGFNRRVDKLGANIIYRYLLNGRCSDPSIDEALKKNTIFGLKTEHDRLIENTRINNKLSRALRESSAWRGMKNAAGNAGAERQKELTSRGAGLTVIVGSAEVFRLMYLLNIARQEGLDNWVLNRQILACTSVIAQCTFDVAAQVARARELIDRVHVPFSSAAYCRYKVGSGIFAGIASGFAVWNDVGNLQKESEVGVRRGVLWCKLGVDIMQASASLYVAATFSARIVGAAAMCTALAEFGAMRILGMMLGPWGILLSVLIEVILWRASDDEVENWIEKSAFGEADTRLQDWLDHPDKQLDELGKALYAAGYRIE